MCRSPAANPVLRHVLGLSNKEIGRSLEISVETVKEHVQNILRKIAVSDRTGRRLGRPQTGLNSVPSRINVSGSVTGRWSPSLTAPGESVKRVRHGGDPEG